MDHRDHVALLEGAVRSSASAGGRWADVGAGRGAFTLALADLLGPGATVVALDLDEGALRVAADAVATRFPDTRIVPIVGDLESPPSVPDLHELDGLVAANSLHFVPPAQQPAALAGLAGRLRPGGTLVVVEYDAERGNPWVPHPFPARRWAALAEAAGIVDPVILHRVPSRFLGAIYSAMARRPGAGTADPRDAGGP